MPEDGCIYFHPTAELYADTILKPKVASVCADTDWMAEIGKRLDRYGLKLVSWTVCMHNTRMGTLHPEGTVQNAFGDFYPHALCPANEQVRRYFIALCRDLARNFPMHGIQLESPGYMGMKHGHHHERDLTVLTPLECTLIDFCFCDACTKRAQSKQIDIERIKVTVRGILEAGMVTAPERPKGHPAMLEEVLDSCPELKDFLVFRQEVEDSLIQEIKAAIVPYSTQLWHFGNPNLQIADAVDVYHGSVYGQKADKVLISTQNVRQALLEKHQLYMGVRLGLNSVHNISELTDIIGAVRYGGGDGVMFYNYSESPMTALNWIKPALATIGQAS